MYWQNRLFLTFESLTLHLFFLDSVKQCYLQTKKHAVTSSEHAHSITWYKQKRRRNRWASKQVSRRYLISPMSKTTYPTARYWSIFQPFLLYLFLGCFKITFIHVCKYNITRSKHSVSYEQINQYKSDSVKISPKSKNIRLLKKSSHFNSMLSINKKFILCKNLFCLKSVPTVVAF